MRIYHNHILIHLHKLPWRWDIGLAWDIANHIPQARSCRLVCYHIVRCLASTRRFHERKKKRRNYRSTFFRWYFVCCPFFALAFPCHYIRIRPRNYLKICTWISLLTSLYAAALTKLQMRADQLFGMKCSSLLVNICEWWGEELAAKKSYISPGIQSLHIIWSRCDSL